VGAATSVSFFFVAGLPAPQGSKSAYVRGGRAVIVDGSSKVGREKHHNWRNDVMVAAQNALNGRATPFSGPTELEVTFYLPLPKSDPHRTRHTTAPDLDKLIRSVGDALVNSGLLKDDSLLYSIRAEKRYARGSQQIGASIMLFDDSDDEFVDREMLKAEAKKARKA